MRRKNYWNVLLLAAAGAVLLAGCSQKDSAPASSAAGDTQAAGETAEAAEESADLLAQIQERGTIIIAMEGTWAPWTYHDEDDNLVGYDVEVGQHIAESLGVEPEFVEGEWDGLLAGLDAGRYDIMINGVNITEDRAQSYDFSEPYAYNRTAVIVRADNTDIQSMEDLAGKHTANTTSSTYSDHAVIKIIIPGRICGNIEGLSELSTLRDRKTVHIMNRNHYVMLRVLSRKLVEQSLSICTSRAGRIGKLGQQNITVERLGRGFRLIPYRNGHYVRNLSIIRGLESERTYAGGSPGGILDLRSVRGVGDLGGCRYITTFESRRKGNRGSILTQHISRGAGTQHQRGRCRFRIILIVIASRQYGQRKHGYERCRKREKFKMPFHNFDCLILIPTVSVLLLRN